MLTFSSRALAALLSAMLAVTAPSVQAQAAQAPSTQAPATQAPATQGQPSRNAPSSSGSAASARVAQDIYQQARSATFRIDRDSGLGTGFFISDDGLALTAYHVIFGARQLTARTLDNQRLAVTVVGYNDAYDIALVKVDVKQKVPFIPLTAGPAVIGEPILTIGNGSGAFLQPKYGNVERFGVDADRKDFPSGTVQLTARLVPGDSGGPLLNARGEALGVVSYIQVERTGGYASFAVPVSQTSALVAALRRGEKADAPVMGISITNQSGTFFDNLRPEAFARMGLGSMAGVVFDFVTPGSPAEKAGLRPVQALPPSSANAEPRFQGDVILAVDGTRVLNFIELLNVVRTRKVGDTVRLSVQRGADTVEVPVVLAGRSQVVREDR